MDKKQLRNETLHTLRMMNQQQYIERSHQLTTQLLQMPAIQEASVIAVTISAFPEVALQPFIEALWQQQKTVVAPKCDAKTRQMDFYQFTSFDELEQVYLHLYEPKRIQTNYVSPRQLDVMIVPGVVFSTDGYRIGFGGGYYDRYLPTTTATRISVAFEEQIRSAIPHEAHDCPVQYIVTEQGIIVSS
ncbi:5-formyltetrahydrofolate cyclo-ligase [Caryophanon tenue]|uniref:5-formyltetrahydrofolate cyclo-ligase n=1 Tax=Caryophanon tenue TaxID=33978 RepID=A0A1C0YNE6_9BACL|nr:5-formyltetrahydrofolate cyclo-ligase [Caryophanon tenue]OCS88589.1 5-formyltetrahydrofolate cyclo-ligase [Caryophanon tenue]